MTTQVAPLGLRLFLEGIEVPVVGAQISIQPGQPASAAIQIVPTDSALLLLPRTLVHLFYLDNDFIDPSTTLREDRVNRNRDDQNRFRVSDEQYKLLFSGEVIGYNYSKSSFSRSLVLQCMDLSSYWDTCYQWFADYSVSGDGLTDKQHNFVVAGQSLFNDVAAGTMWVVGNILASRPENPDYSKTEGLLAGLIHLLETIGGLRPKKGANYKSFKGVNDFFTIAELRYNLSGMLGAVESDKTSVRMFNSKAFRDWLKNGMTSAGSLVTYRDILALVGQYIFHDVYPNPAAFYVKGGTKITQRSPEYVANTATGSTILADIQSGQDKLKAARANVLGSMFDIEVSAGPVLVEEALKLLDKSSEGVSTSGSGDASRVNNYILLASSGARSVLTDFRSLPRRENTISLAPSVGVSIASKLQTCIDNLNRVLKSGSSKKTKEKNVQITTGDHLYTHLMLPETFFVVPPRCNVLFPDMYFSFTYSRNFLREVTRLSCRAGLGMIAGGSKGTEFLGSNYFAPNMRGVRGQILRSTIFAQGSIILPHEVHSGIIPKYEWVTDGHRWGTEAAKATGKNSQNQKVNYIQRLANFQFFMHRWGARSMNVNARFNPHLVLGFPGLVIDRATPSIGVIQSLEGSADESQALLPTAYIGKIATIQHMIGQDGGTTSVVYSQARTHRGIDDEFLGVLATDQNEKVKSKVVATVEPILRELRRAKNPADKLEKYSTQLLLIQLFAQGRLQVNIDTIFGRISELSGLEDQQQAVTSSDFSLLGLSFDDFLTLHQRQGGVAGVDKVNIPSEIKCTLDTKANKGKYIRREGETPFEELVRPLYYSPDVWDNSNITEKVYLPLIGSRAITDDEQIGDPAQFADLVKSALDSTTEVSGVVAIVEEGNSVVLKVDGRTVATIGLNLKTGTTTETAIDGLTLLYGILKKKNLDVQSFIDDYVKRPIASMVEILGDSDLQFDKKGDPIARADGTLPVEGFHSRAFGPYNIGVKQRVDTGDGSTPPEAGKDAFFALIPSDKIEEFSNATTIIDKGKSAKGKVIPSHLDPRGRAQARVRAYVSELAASRGILAT